MNADFDGCVGSYATLGEHGGIKVRITKRGYGPGDAGYQGNSTEPWSTEDQEEPVATAASVS